MRTRTTIVAWLVVMAAGDAYARPTFTEVECFLDDCRSAHRDSGIVFGRVAVPESRGRPDGRTLDLGVAVLKARSEPRQPDPVVYLAGGPGVSALFSIEYFAGHYLRENRDIILFDARGVGYSEPSICPELGREFMALLASGQSPEQEIQAKIGHYQRCYTSLQTGVVDLGGYSAHSIAADVADIRLALGYETWNLYGISYGTHYAMAVMRDHPDGLRSVILDSVVPMGKPHFIETAKNYRRALDTYFAACAAHEACARTFPDLYERFLDTARSLAEAPLTVPLASGSGVPGDRFVVDFQDLHLAVHQMLYDNDFYPVLPLLIATFERRDRVVLARLLPALARGLNRYSFAHAMLVNRHDSGRLLDESVDRDPELARGLSFLEADVAAMDVWPSAIGGEREVTPVRSDVPTLVLAGTVDPITPPAYGRFAAGFLSRAHYVQFPTIGHGASRSGPCPQSVVESFIDEPSSTPETGCVAAMGPIPFITDVRINSHVVGLAIAVFQDRQPGVVVPLAVLLLLLVSALLFGLWAIIARLRGPAGTHPRTAALARVLMVLGAALGLTFLAGLGYFVSVTAQANPYLLVFGLIGAAAPLLLLPYPLALLATATAVMAVQAWRQSWWNRLARVHFTLVAAAQLGILVVIALYRLW